MGLYWWLGVIRVGGGVYIPGGKVLRGGLWRSKKGGFGIADWWLVI